eukprot:4345644-Amphidinium_carterae.1
MLGRSASCVQETKSTTTTFPTCALRQVLLSSKGNQAYSSSSFKCPGVSPESECKHERSTSCFLRATMPPVFHQHPLEKRPALKEPDSTPRHKRKESNCALKPITISGND